VYAANWAVAAVGAGLGTLGHMWSLSIEEQFYLVWPAMLAIILRRGRWNGRSTLLAIAVLALASWLLTVGLMLVDAPARIAANATPTRAIELLIGAMFAVYAATPGLSGSLERCRSGSLVSVAGALAGLLLLALVPLAGLSDAVNAIVLWPVIAMLTCVVIYSSMRAAPLLTSVLASRVLTEVGKRSYGLYLWHFPVFVLIDTRWGLDGWVPRLSGLAVTAILVLLSYRFVERPFLERKNAPRTGSRRAATSESSRLAKVLTAET
jgi:peptidoglycan/LPS O-acetylase OafA/YrhL